MQTVDSRLITLCHCMFLKCNEHTTLVGGMLIMGEAMHVVGRWGGGVAIWEISVLSFNFARNM